MAFKPSGFFYSASVLPATSDYCSSSMNGSISIATVSVTISDPVVTVTVNVSASAPANQDGLTKIVCQMLSAPHISGGSAMTEATGLQVTVLTNASKLVPSPVMTIITGSGIQRDLSRVAGVTSILTPVSTVTVAVSCSPLVAPVAVTVSEQSLVPLLGAV